MNNRVMDLERLFKERRHHNELLFKGLYMTVTDNGNHYIGKTREIAMQRAKVRDPEARMLYCGVIGDFVQVQ